MTQNPAQPPARLKHSGPGIASFIVSASSFLLGIGAVIVFSTIDGRLQLSPFCSCGLPTGFVGLILGIIGVALPGRKKLFAYLGLALAVVNLLLNFILIMNGFIN